MKKKVLEELPQLFAHGRSKTNSDNDKLVSELYRQIGQLKVELDWLQKKRRASVEQKRQLVEPACRSLSVARQCELLGLPRASFYYTPIGESPQNLLYMRLLDKQYTKRPCYRVPKLTDWLRRQGYVVNPKRVARLMRKMGLVAIYPKPRTSGMGKPSKVYPYLLKGLSITKPNHVWATDITYIRLSNGFVYLVAVMDWFSRFVLSWELSNSLGDLYGISIAVIIHSLDHSLFVRLIVFFCLSALERALSQSSPLIFNNDQGSQFTSEVFTARLESSDIAISWNGRDRYFDNIFVERLWRSVKYEEVYLNDYDSMDAARRRLRARHYPYRNNSFSK